MPHETIKKIYQKLPAVQYSRKQEERQARTKEGRELLEQTKPLRKRVRTFKRLLKRKFQIYDE